MRLSGRSDSHRIGRSVELDAREVFITSILGSSMEPLRAGGRWRDGHWSVPTTTCYPEPLWAATREKMGVAEHA